MDVSSSSSASSSLTPSSETLRASSVFVLLRSSIRVSRNVRAEWIFDRLHPGAQPIVIPNVVSVDEQELSDDDGLTAVGVVPANPPPEWSWSKAHKYAYRLTTSSKVTFLPQRHGLVFLLDLSLSSATFTSTVDSSFETLMETLRRCLTALIRPYLVPGSQLMLRPTLFVTVVAWTPFLCPDGQSVLVQARLLTSDNADLFLHDIAIKACQFVAELASRKGMEAEREAMEAKNINDRITGGLFDNTNNQSADNTQSPVTNPNLYNANSSLATLVASDSGFVDLIRSCVTAIHLMPKLISGSIIVVGDGSFSVPDIESCDMLLNQLRTKTISLSFLSSLSTLPESSRSTHGLSALTYKDLLEFVAQSTHGVALFDAPKIEFVDNNINWYHEAFLTWSFRKVKMLGKFIGLDSNIDFETLQRSRRLRAPINKYFQSERFERSIRKILERRVRSHFFNLLSCRLREGFVFRCIKDLDSKVIEVGLTLPWKIGSLMHYVMHASWPLRQREQEIRINIFIEGDYETLHDIICKRSTGLFGSRERNAVSVKYTNILSHLKNVDKLLLLLNSFKSNQEHYTLPDSIEKGEPLFQIGSKAPTLVNCDLANTAFAMYWKPISSLDISIWHRWMHTIRIHALLYHDYPLPRHLLQPNSSGRYTMVQCRKAAFQLSRMLKELSHFVLVENTSFITFLDEDTSDDSDNDSHEAVDSPTKKSRSFYLMRLTMSGPCIVLWLAFTGGTALDVRSREIDRIKEGLRNLKIKQLVSWHQDMNPYDEHHTPTESSACRLMEKPLDKIMVRYERCPHDLECVVNFEALRRNDACGPQQGLRCESPGSSGRMHPQSPRKQSSREYLSASSHLSLSRYLCHHRWIFHTSTTASDSFLTEETAVKTLNLLLKTRLMEGFTVAHSMDGVQTMATELSICDHTSAVYTTLLVQYVIFPPVRVVRSRREEEEVVRISSSSSSLSSMSSREETATILEEDTIQLAIEIWVEPQDGFIADSILNGSRAMDVGTIFIVKDQKLVRAITSFHFLAMATVNQEVEIEDILVPNNEDNVEDKILDNDYKKHYMGNQVSHVLLQCHLLEVLQHATRASNTFELFIQEFYLEPNIGSNLNSSNEADKMNEILLKMLAAEVRRLNTTEVELPACMMKALNHFLDPQWQPKSTSTPVKNTKGQNQDQVEKSYTPRWRCFLRPQPCKDESRFVVTLIPFNYEAVKAFCRRRYKGDNTLFKMTTASGSKKTPSLSSSYSSLSEESMRKRTHSADNSTVRPSDRLSLFCSDSGSSEPRRGRCMSMDSKKEESEDTNEPQQLSHKKSAPRHRQHLRPRTHTYSYFNAQRPMRNATRPFERLKHARGGARTPSQISTNNKTPNNNRTSPSVVNGCVALPIIIYECSELSFVAELLGNQKGDMYDNHESKNEDNDVDNVLEDDKVEKNISKEVEAYRKDLSRAFVHSFVSVMYNCLRQGIANVHELDVTRVLGLCTQENLTDIDLNPLLHSVCQHRLDTLRSIAVRPHRSCAEVCGSLHRLISKKFMDAVQLDFQPVSSSLESSLFFFAPPSSLLKTRQQREFGSNRHRRDTRDTLFGSYTSGCHSRSEHQMDYQHDEVVIEFSHEPYLRDELVRDKGLNGLHRTTTSSVVDNMDDTRVSYEVSNAFDSDPSSDLNDLINEDDANFESATPSTTPVQPLFLRLSTFVIAPPVANGDEFDSRPYFEKNVDLTRLPTCFLDVVQDCNLLQSDKWDVAKTSVSLELVCFSLADDSGNNDDDGDKSDNEEQKEDDDLMSSSSLSAYANVTFSTALSRHLEASQKRSLEVLVAKTRWMIRDEVVFALARTRRASIDRKLLDEVADHVKTSCNRPGCSYQRITFDFVMGVDQSFHRLQRKLDCLEVPGFDIVWPEGDDHKVFFVVHHDNGEHEAREENFDQTPLSSSELHCWLIVFVSRHSIEIVFQYREGQLTQVLPWRQAQMFILSELDMILTRVNQELLLKDLYDSKRCNRLLEPENAAEVWSKSELNSWQKSSLIETVRLGDDDFDDDEHTRSESKQHVLEANLKLHFEEGQFSCPIVFEKYLWLHPRLCQSVGRGMESQGMLAVKTTLSNFSILNRSNMFVYGDGEQNVFYLKIEEHISQGENVATQVRPVASASYIKLQVHGVTKPGSAITSDLLSVLQYKLSELVVNNLSTVLQRNPMSKLSSEDVLFLQANDAEDKQECKITFLKIDPRIKAFFTSFELFLHQHMIHAGKFILPKYKANTQFHSSPLKLLDNNKGARELGSEDKEGQRKSTENKNEGEQEDNATIYLFNHQTLQSGGHRGIAVVALIFHCLEKDNKSKEVEISDHLSEVNLQEFLNLDEGSIIKDNAVSKEDEVNNFGVEIRVWERGRSYNAELTKLLASYTQHALWDVLMERLYLHTSYQRSLSSLLSWLKLGMERGTSSLQRFSLSLRNAAEIDLLAEEIRSHMSKVLSPLQIEVFEKKDKTCFITAQAPTESNVASLLKFKSPDDNKDKDVSKRLASRQPFVLVHLDALINNVLTLFFYNITTGLTETLMRPVLTTLHWIVGREALATSIAMQKLGLFYNQKLFRSKVSANIINTERTNNNRGALINPFLSSVKCVDLLERTNTPLKAPSRLQARSWAQPTTEDAFRFKYHDHRDLAETLRCRTQQGRDREMLKEYSFEVSPSKSIEDGSGIKKDGEGNHQADKNVKAGITETLGKTWKIEKEEMTCWQRLIDCDLALSRSSGDIVCNLNRLRRLRSEETNSLFTQLPLSCLRFLQRVCGLVHCCYTPLLFFPRWCNDAIETRCCNSYGREDKSQEKETPGQKALLDDFFRQFEHYIYTFGFVPFRIDNLDKESVSSKERHLRFFHKSLPGGLLFLESGVCAPFFFVRLLAVESSFLNTKKSSAPSYSVQKSRLNQCIVEEVERIKVLLQLHSFAYDYHLQTMHKMLSTLATATSSFSVTPRFLLSFLRYYPKSPSYCRSIVLRAKEPVLIECDPLVTPPTVLFEYVLQTKEGALPFRVVNPREDDNYAEISEKDGRSGGAEEKSSPVLVRQSSVRLMAADTHVGDEELDLSLIVARLDADADECLKLDLFVVLAKHGRNPLRARHIKETLNSRESSGVPRASSLVQMVSLDDSEHYVGFYSTQEQLFLALARSELTNAARCVSDKFSHAITHCRRDMLWSSIVEKGSDSISGIDLVELLGLVHVSSPELMGGSNLASILRQVDGQVLVRFLMQRLGAKRATVVGDANELRLIILGPDEKSRKEACVIIQSDSSTKGCSLRLVARKETGLLSSQGKENNLDPLELVEEVINLVGAHFWETLAL